MAISQAFTDFSTVSLPNSETEMSRRYLRLIERWIPVGMRYFNDWPVRPCCGHFFGGVLWYGLDTVNPIMAIAAAASSTEFDAAGAGAAPSELQQVVRKGLRYLLFTHDTGPEDCVRPKESWGRKEPAGTKWGERGRGFFPESQCGCTIGDLVIAAALIRQLLGPEEHEMLRNVAADYLGRFGSMPPRSGVYYDTQMEENAWTAEGLVACLLLLPGHENHARIWDLAKRWMFCTSTQPEDMYDHTPFADGKTVRQLCGVTYTTLPDGTAENHGFVHPMYLASSITLSGLSMNLLRLFGAEIPPHIFWRRQQAYDILKSWSDSGGTPHCVQGMDWPYLWYPVQAFLHALANVYLKDPDAAFLERRTLEIVEQSVQAHGGRLVPDDTVKHCHSQQDPALMTERVISCLAAAYLAHRMNGPAEAPSASESFGRRVRGVRVYPHGGALVHRHERGVTSLAWRNRTMILPATREGLRLIGPVDDSMLARIQVREKPTRVDPIDLRIRDGVDRVSAVLLQNLAGGTVRREVFLASLPSGQCLIIERLTARETITVEGVEQGHIRVINDGYFGDRDDRRGLRRVYWNGGERSFSGYPAGPEVEDVVLDLSDTPWVNVDDRFGFIFRSTGKAEYRNRHHFKVWHAVVDDLYLSIYGGPFECKPGDRVASLVALWCPEQTHKETRQQALDVHESPVGVIAVEIGTFMCTCNFSEQRVDLPVSLRCPAGQTVTVSPGLAIRIGTGTALTLSLAAHEATILDHAQPV